MAAKDLTSTEKEQLAEIVGQIKETKAYKNYQAGLSVNKRRLESSPGEGDAFAKAGEMIRSGKIPTWLHASAVGQTKVEKALQALLKEKKLHGLLKDGEFKEALYDELYVESGALNRFLINDGREAAAEAGQELADNPGPADDHTAAADSNTKPQEEKMAENSNNNLWRDVPIEKLPQKMNSVFGSETIGKEEYGDLVKYIQENSAQKPEETLQSIVALYDIMHSTEKFGSAFRQINAHNIDDGKLIIYNTTKDILKQGKELPDELVGKSKEMMRYFSQGYLSENEVEKQYQEIMNVRKKLDPQKELHSTVDKIQDMIAKDPSSWKQAMNIMIGLEETVKCGKDDDLKAKIAATANYIDEFCNIKKYDNGNYGPIDPELHERHHKAFNNFIAGDKEFKGELSRLSPQIKKHWDDFAVKRGEKPAGERRLLPEYDDGFYNTDVFNNLGIKPGEDGKYSADQIKKIEEAHSQYAKSVGGKKKEEQQAVAGGGSGPNGPNNNGNSANNGGDGDKGKDGSQSPDGNDAGNGGDQGSAITVDQDANDAKTKQPPVDEPWVVKYNEALTKWGKEHDNEWTRDNEPNEAGEYPVGLKGNFKDGTELHYTAKDKVSVKAPEGQEITADHFAAVIALAKENDQDLKLGATMSPAFKKALLEAAARDGVTIQGLSAEDQQLYDSFKPKEPEQKEPEQKEPEQNQEPQAEQKKPEQKVEVQRKEVKDTDEHGDSLYKVSPTVVEGWMTMYRAKAASKLLDPMIANHEKLLAAGAYEVTGGEKARAQLLAMKYVQAMSKGDKEQADLCVTAMQRYGIDTVSRQSKTKDNNGRDTVTAKPYAERTDEEKAKINEAAEKMLPKKAQTYDPSVMRALAERQGQTLQ